MKAKGSTQTTNAAVAFLFSRGWRNQIASDARAAAFLSGLAILIINGCSIKARHDALIATPPKVRRSLIKTMKDLDDWEWDSDDEVFISYYPGG